MKQIFMKRNFLNETMFFSLLNRYAQANSNLLSYRWIDINDQITSDIKGYETEFFEEGIESIDFIALENQVIRLEKLSAITNEIIFTYA